MCGNVKAPCKGDAALKFPDMGTCSVQTSFQTKACKPAVNTFYMVSSVLLCKMAVCLPAGTEERCPWFSHNSRLPRALVQTLAVNKAAPGELDAPQVCRGRKHTKRPCPLAQSVTVAICPHCIIMGITSQPQALIHKHGFRFPQTGPFFTSPGRVHFPAVNTECKHIPQVENIL